MRYVSTSLVGLAVSLSSSCASLPPREAARSHVRSRTTGLFNGRDLSGWTYQLADSSAKMGQVWSVKDGVLICQGRPAGYIRTEKEYNDYVLTLEWRWPPGTRGGNNGVLVHASSPRAIGIWPKSIEVQLKAGHAGDLWIIGTGLDVENAADRRQGRRHLNLTDDSEKPIGQWNHLEVTCRADEIAVKVNGVLVNHATNCSVTKGAICLQSEGAPIEFRNIQLTPLKPEVK